MKTCTRCGTEKPFTEFPRRSASKDGYAAGCKACVNEAKQVIYWLKEGERAKHIARATKNKRERCSRDPSYKRAWNLWLSTRDRTHIPGWVSIMDFIHVARKAVQKGDEYQVDHIIPLNHPLVCGLHVPSNCRVVKREVNQRKKNHFLPRSEATHPFDQ